MNLGTEAKISIIGAGYMGGGMAQVFAMAGHKVLIFDIDAETTRRSYDRLIDESKTFEELGLFAPGSAKIIEENLGYKESIEEVVTESPVEEVFEPEAVVEETPALEVPTE